MNILPSNVQKLMQLLQRIPGLGPKSAARVAMFLLTSPKGYTKELGEVIANLKEEIVYCKMCFNIASSTPCEICDSQERDESIICVVEDPLDVLAFENGTDFKGKYHVLGGVISPVNGIGPEDLTIAQLINRLEGGKVKEIIIATNPNIEGEATAMYIKQEILNLSSQALKVGKRDLKITRLARGLPSGADLEYADKTTLKKSFEGRTNF
ncbi:recombination protein RecR [Candidatus Dojkabacteria bacterium]|nr:recombination protein RecR [Candidatus Dojkabacteria bacterium]